MNTFLAICLYAFAVCAALGLIPPALLAARERKPALVVLALLIAAFVICVLVAAGWELTRA